VSFQIPDVSSSLTDQDRRVLVEWIDMGATFATDEEANPGTALINGSGEKE
jgi:hypothetical protein